MAISWGLGWKRWSKNGAGKSLYFIQLFLRHILFDENFIGYVNLHHILFDEKFYWLFKVSLYSVCLNLNHEKPKMWMLERWWYLSKSFDHYNHKFQLFNCSAKFWRNLKLNLDRNLFMALLIMAICKVLFEKLYIILR